MVDLAIGALVMAMFVSAVNRARQRGAHLGWWQWMVTGLAFVYVAFVLRIVSSFLVEGTWRGAFVVGASLGVVAVVWLALVKRFVLARAPGRQPATSDVSREPPERKIR